MYDPSFKRVGRETFDSKFLRQVFAEEIEQDCLRIWRDSIRIVLEARFGKEAAADAVSRLARIADETELDRIIQRAARCKGIEKLSRQLARYGNA